jgi:hypothetical protein
LGKLLKTQTLEGGRIGGLGGLLLGGSRKPADECRDEQEKQEPEVHSTMYLGSFRSEAAGSHCSVGILARLGDRDVWKWTRSRAKFDGYQR